MAIENRSNVKLYVTLTGSLKGLSTVNGLQSHKRLLQILEKHLNIETLLESFRKKNKPDRLLNLAFQTCFFLVE